MIRIKLAEDDRVKLELPEWIEYDVNRPRLRDIRRLKAEVGWEWSQVWDGLNHDDIDARLATRAVLVWLAVDRLHPVSWEEFDCDILGVEVEEPDPNAPAPDGAET